MTAPVGPKTTTTIAKKSPLIGLFTLGAIATAGWMIRDSFTGSRQRINHRMEQLKENNNYNYTQSDWGRWSGNPSMDNLTQKWSALKIFGPFNLRQDYLSLKIRVSSFFSDIIMPNILPIGIAIAGLYGTFGAKTMHKPFRAIGKWASTASVPKRLKQDLGRVLPKIGSGIGQGAFSIIKWPFQSLPHLVVGTGATLLGTYFLKRFSDASNGEGQSMYFRDELLGRSPRPGKF